MVSKDGLRYCAFHDACMAKAPACAALEMTAPRVGVVPHSCEPSEATKGAVSVVTGPSKSVRVAPSIRRSTVTGAADAGDATARSPATVPAITVSFMLRATPFHEGVGLVVGGRSPGFRDYRSRLPKRMLSGRLDAVRRGFPGDSGGSAPDSHRLP